MQTNLSKAMHCTMPSWLMGIICSIAAHNKLHDFETYLYQAYGHNLLSRFHHLIHVTSVKYQMKTKGRNIFYYKSEYCQHNMPNMINIIFHVSLFPSICSCLQMEDRLSLTLFVSLHHSHFAFIIGDAEHLCSQRTTNYQ